MRLSEEYEEKDESRIKHVNFYRMTKIKNINTSVKIERKEQSTLEEKEYKQLAQLVNKSLC